MLFLKCVFLIFLHTVLGVKDDLDICGEPSQLPSSVEYVAQQRGPNVDSMDHEGPLRYRGDYHWISALRGWVKVHRAPVNWTMARLQCELEGAVLASPTNPDMLNVLMTVLKEAQLPCRLFTGIHALFADGIYVAVDGTPVEDLESVLNFTASCTSTNRCTAISLSMIRSGLRDADCAEKMNYVCYKKYQPGMVTGDCSTTDPAYKYNWAMEKCYKFHIEPKTWHEAYRTCAAERAYLVILNSKAESIEMKKLMEEYPPETFTHTEFNDLVHAGYHTFASVPPTRHPMFFMYTIHGETLQEAGFSTWDEGQPNDTGVCGGIYRTGLLNDVDCTILQPFICEKEPEYF